jgi:hypothetical protein
MALGQAFMPGFANAHLGGDQAFLGYGAVILSFMGGVRWGARCAVCSPNAIETMILSVAPSLAGWLALLIDRPWSLLLLLAGFGLQGVWDVASARNGALPSWFGAAPGHQRHRSLASIPDCASVLICKARVSHSCG